MPDDAASQGAIAQLLAGIQAEDCDALWRLLEEATVSAEELRPRLEAHRAYAAQQEGLLSGAAALAAKAELALAFALLQRLEEGKVEDPQRALAAALLVYVAAGEARALAAGSSAASAERGAANDGEAPGEPRLARARTRRRRTHGVIAFALGLGLLPLYFVLTRQSNPTWKVAPREGSPRTPPIDGAQLRDGTSNIHRADYVEPRRCAECHQEKQALLVAHPHSRMNAEPSPESVQGDFSGRQLTYGDYSATFDRSPEGYRMTLEREGRARRRWRVTRTVGSRFTQMYIGLQIEGPEARDDAVWTTEVKLPFGYWITRVRWLPANYFDSDFLPDYDAAGSNEGAVRALLRLHRWERSCIFCHNTYPYDLRLRARMDVVVGFPLDDLKLEPAPPVEQTLLADELITLGVTCQSCHFGGRDHVTREAPVRFLPTAPDLEFPAATASLVETGRASAYAVNSICAQCHSARVTCYPDGSATWNSREAADMLGGACATVLKCTDCHDPHLTEQFSRATAASTQVALCVGCHEALAEAPAQAGHSHHAPEVSCLDCHMPRRVQGLDGVIRTHRIGSPTNVDMLRQGAPNACNLCHLERSLGWTLAALARDWGAEIEPQADWAAGYGRDLEAPVGEVWLQHEVPVMRLVAASAWGHSPLGRGALPLLLAALDDPNPVNRMFALFAVERVLGRKLADDEYRPTDTPAQRASEVDALQRALR
ncbi:MAG: ammonia-forming cytochrome c nitrite reductase subunit c552 [Planctomycetes bacterium]|nr:ammonia-forming cytochrome c nitrite reductase subunit c552 [Planctomycetota bacterium]